MKNTVATVEAPSDTGLDQFAFIGRVRAFVEKSRVAVQVHLAHLERLKRRDPLAEGILPRLVEIEEIIEDSMREQARSHPIWLWASKIKGCGPTVVGAVLSRVDIRRVDTVSQMWAHFGFAPGQRRVAGQRITYDPIGRAWCWRLGTQLLKANGKCKAIYDKRKLYEKAKVEANGMTVLPGKLGELEGISVGHIHARAMRYMIKTWLACAWLVWREAEGLSVRSPYAAEHPGSDGMLHDQWYKPEDLMDR